VRSQVELFLVATRAHRVEVPGAGLTARLAAGEPIRTAVFRAWRPAELERLLTITGFRPVHTFLATDGSVGLALAERVHLSSVRSYPPPEPRSAGELDAMSPAA